MEFKKTLGHDITRLCATTKKGIYHLKSGRFMPNHSHCLRPVFTQTLLKRLKNGESINLLSDDPADSQRLLQDLQKLEPEIYWIQVSFKAYAKSFSGFLSDVNRQLPKALQSANAPTNWQTLVALLEKIPQPVCLWFEALHSLFGNEQIDSAYDWSFIDSLNALHNDGHFAIVGVTDKKLLYPPRSHALRHCY